jgi:preprotein translocase subunit SecE
MAANTSVNKAGRMSGYFKGVKAELKKVTWPTRKELMTYTMVVIVAVTLMTLVVWGLDVVFHSLFGIFV